jgi:hypothetical protein
VYEIHILAMRPSLYALLGALGLVAGAPVSLPISNQLQNILDNTDKSQLYTYPTSITQDIVPKRIHSHNDYWRPLPFWSALSVGAISIEADVWLYNDTLYVGHESAALTPQRTLQTLYIDPIMSVLNSTNPVNAFTSTQSHPNGVFDTSSGQTLYLFIDLKTSGPETWPVVVDALEPLRSAGYLTTYNGTSNGITPGPVTVIGTGNTPQSNFTDPTEPRDYFFDANLAMLSTTQSNITSDISPIASCQFSRFIGEITTEANSSVSGFNETQLETLRGHLSTAAEKGIKGRYWDTPGWPTSVRNGVWEVLEREGVGLLNADDLVAAAGFNGWTSGNW